jgi:3-hydroxymyristoyl/3-hydroxydecanoyl-(acyl carrier protein) dehydratase
MSFDSFIPDVLSEAYGDDRYTCDLIVDATQPCFEGHFPGQPIVPGVVQLGWAIHFGTQLGLDADKFAGVSRCKYTAVISPGTKLTITLTRSDQRSNFRIESEQKVHATGVINYAQ